MVTCCIVLGVLWHCVCWGWGVCVCVGGWKCCVCVGGVVRVCAGVVCDRRARLSHAWLVTLWPRTLLLLPKSQLLLLPAAAPPPQ